MRVDNSSSPELAPSRNEQQAFDRAKEVPVVDFKSPVNEIEQSVNVNDNNVKDANNTEQTAQPQVNMEEVAQKLQEFVGGLNVSLQFSVDEESGRDVIKVMDKESGEVVRQFPSEEVLEVIKSLGHATGILFNETA